MPSALLLVALSLTLAAARDTLPRGRSATQEPDRGAASRPAAPARVHLVELFTSHACGLCPPADALVGELPRLVAGSTTAVAIAWHVDLWDEADCKDPFVLREAPRRQRDYARGFDCAAYTPMAVVDGSCHVVGSDAQALALALAGRAEPWIGLHLALADDGQLQVRIEGVPAARRSALDLWVVLVEDAVRTRVTGGENHGRELHENAVARCVLRCASLQQLGLTPTVPLDCRRVQDLGHASVVAFVQERDNRAVLQAARLPLVLPASRPAR